MNENLDEISKVRKFLSNHTRDLILFELAYSTATPIKELLSLKIGDVKDLQPQEMLPVRTVFGSNGQFRLTQNAYDAIQLHLKDALRNVGDDDYLFQSGKKAIPLSVSSASRIMRKWWAMMDNKNINSLTSLRKSYNENIKETTKKTTIESAQLLADDASLTEISAESTQTLVYKQLEKAILSGEIKPGQKLITEDLSRMMKVSRIPVREAMGRLQAKGLIVTRPKWGSVVNELSISQLNDILELRLLLEIRAAEKATGNISEGFISELKEAQENYRNARKTSDTDLLLACNRRFHFVIYQQAGSPVLLEMITQLWDKVSPYYHMLFRQSLEKSPKAGVKSHEMIIKHIEKENIAGVTKWLKKDLKESAKFIYTLFFKD